MRNRLQKLSPLRAAIVVALGTSPLMAGAQSEEEPAGRKAVEEVMVTATRRAATDIQTTPVTVTAISGDDIAMNVPRNLGDVAAFVPNFSAAQVSGFNAASYAIRGIGQTDIIIYQDAPVGVIVDDFVMPSIQTQLLDTFDIQNVEVLRGPQGTLFGKNTTGGAVNVKTKDPDVTAAYLDLVGQAGNFGLYSGKFAVNVPLVDDEFAIRFAGNYTRSDGFYKNGARFGPVTPFIDINGVSGLTGGGDGRDFGGQDVFTGRFKARWEPSDNFTAQFTYEIVRDDSDTPPTVNLTPPNDPRFVFNLLGYTQDPGDPLDTAGLTLRDELLLNMSQGHRIDVDGFYLNLDWDIGDYTLSSVTGYREQESRLPNTYPGEAGPISLFDATRDDNRETFQQEFRIASDFAGPVNFVAGAFYQQNDAEFCVLQVLGFLDLLGLGEANFGDPLFFNNNPQILCNAQDATAQALFGDVTWDVTDRLSIGVGFRYTDEEKEWRGRNQVFIQALNGGFDPNFTVDDLNEPLDGADFARFPTGVVSDDESWEEPTYRLNVSYQFTPDVFGYFTYARGFRSGGYNDQTGTTGFPITPELAAPYDPEFADSFEFGVKTDLFDNRLRFNATAFYVEYEDAQRALVATLTNEFGQQFQETRFFNAADLTVQGLELEATAIVSDRFTINANLGYLDGEYDTFEADTDQDGDIDVDLSNRPLQRAPELQFTIGGNYDQQLANGGSILWNANVYYEDEAIFIYSDVDPSFDTTIPEKTLINGSVTYFAPNDQYFVRLWGRNLGDERYVNAAQPVANLWTFGTFGEPRSYGVEVGFGWDF